MFALEGAIELKKKLASIGTILVPVKAESNSKAAEMVGMLSKRACEVITDAGFLRPDLELEEAVNRFCKANRKKYTKVEGDLVVPVKVIFVVDIDHWKLGLRECSKIEQEHFKITGH